MRKRILVIALAALMIFSNVCTDMQVFAAESTDITAIKSEEAPYTGKEYVAASDKTKASEASSLLPSGWEWGNPDLELTTEFVETQVVQKDASGNEKNRVTVKVKKEDKADGPAAPSGLTATAPTTKNGTDGKITGVNDTMEYSADNGKTWTSVPAGATQVSGFKEADEVLVRVKETSTTKAGATQIVTIPTIPVDTTAPTGSIKISTNTWNSFLNGISFGQLFKETKTVTIDASDNVAVASVKYYASNKALSLEEVKALDTEWIDYPSAGFTLEPTNKYVVYALITDTSGNKTYLSSDGMVFLTETVPGLFVTEVTNKSFTIRATVDENATEGVKEVGIYYRKKGDTSWTKVMADTVSADADITVDNLAAGTDYEVRTYVIYTDDTQTNMPEDNATTVTTDAALRPTGTISVKIENDSDEVKDAVITVEQGNNVIASVLKENISNDGVPTDSGCFKELPDGVYNIVIRTTDGKYVETKMITVENGSSNEVVFIIAKGELESVVDIKGEDTPPVAVDGLKEILEDNEAVISEEEKEKIENGQISVEIIFEVDKKDQKEAIGGNAIERLAEKSGLTVDLFLDLSLFKVTTQLTGEHAGESTNIDVGGANKSVLEIAVPYDTTKKNIRVFRCHEGVTTALTELTEKPKSDLVDGTFFVGNGYVFIYASGFSTYGIGGMDDRLDGPAAPSGLTATAPTSKGGNDGKISGVTTDMEYSIDNGENWIPVTGNPITGLTPGKVLVRYAGTPTVKPGASAEVTVPDYSDVPGKADGPAAPDVTPVAPTSENGTDGKVTGVDETMEYSVDGGNTWKPVLGTEITGLAAGTNVTVRVKETDTTKAGASKVVVIPEYKAPVKPGKADGPAAPSGLTATAPTSKGGNDGTIGGVTTAMEYSTDGGKTWIPVTADPITGLTPGKVLVRYAETETVKAGASVEVTVPDYTEAPGKADGPAAPDVTPVAPTSKDGTDGKVTGVDETMEYSLDGGNTWNPVMGTEITGLAAGTTVTVRVKETDTTKAGASKVVVIPEYKAPVKPGKAAGPAAPSGLVGIAPTIKDGTDGQISGVNSTMEYSTDGGKTWKDVLGDTIGGLSAGEVWVRVKETADTEAGAIAKVTVPKYADPISETPKTGDVNNLSLWISILLMGVVLFVVVLVTDKIKRRRHIEGE